MKCPNCGGTGVIHFGNIHVLCGKCKAIGFIDDEPKPKKQMTEQEYIQTCNTEQLAKVLGNIAKNAYQCCENGKTNQCVNRHNCTGYCDYGWEKWLKEKRDVY